ncbi:unnamed protein product [Effrenium voratum]|nr:unnamed protein product [Effrenium voratum]
MSWCRDEALASSPTALMFKLGCKMSQQEFLLYFDTLCGFSPWSRPYDFVHLPWSSLAIVNFVSEEACAVCFVRTKQLSQRAYLRGVRPAAKHGLHSNLVDFLSRHGNENWPAKRLPLVFHKGRQITLAEACRLIGLGLIHTTEHSHLHCQIHLDQRAMYQAATWERLKQMGMPGMRILIDL